jgi:hypothetical protein
VEISNPKFQIPNNSQSSIFKEPKHPFSSPFWGEGWGEGINFGHWDFGYYLDIGAWDLVLMKVILSIGGERLQGRPFVPIHSVGFRNAGWHC